MISNLIRLFKTFFFLTFVVHLLACLWIRIGVGVLRPFGNHTSWVEEFGFEPHQKFKIYVHAFEFITATFTTIGYGSLYAVGGYEKSSMCVLIVISLIMFSLIMKQI